MFVSKYERKKFLSEINFKKFELQKKIFRYPRYYNDDSSIFIKVFLYFTFYTRGFQICLDENGYIAVFYSKYNPLGYITLLALAFKEGKNIKERITTFKKSLKINNSKDAKESSIKYLKLTRKNLKILKKEIIKQELLNKE